MIRNLITRTLVVTTIAAGGFTLTGTAVAADNADSGGTRVTGGAVLNRQAALQP